MRATDDWPVSRERRTGALALGAAGDATSRVDQGRQKEPHVRRGLRLRVDLVERLGYEHALERDEPFVARVELVVVMQHQIDEGVAIDEA